MQSIGSKFFCLVALILLFSGLVDAAAIPRAEMGSAATNHTHKSVLYLAEWKYGFQPKDLPEGKLSHVLYSFGNIRDDGTIFIVDQQQAFDNGYVKQLMEFKTKNRGVKTLLSVGGWTYTHEATNLQIAASTVAGQKKFAQSAVEHVKNLGLDGIDIDWEYPTNDTEAKDYVALLKEVRNALDAYAKKSAPGYHFLVTVACPAGARTYLTMRLKEMDRYLDAWHLMAYDFSGSWEDLAGHAANLFKSSQHPETTPISTHAAVNDYIEAGIAPEKIVFGMPLYGQVFKETSGLGSLHAKVSEQIEYRELPRAGAVEHYDPNLVATWSYDPSKRELASYQGIEETRAKSQYIKEKGLGGSMWWMASMDKTGKDSLISASVDVLGNLENSTNLLYYPESRYQFVKDVASSMEVKELAKEPAKDSEQKEHEKQLHDAGSALFKIGHWLGLW